MDNKEQLPKGREILPMARAERGRRGRITAAPEPPVREKELAPPPTKEEKAKANAGAYAGETKVVEKVGKNRLLKPTLGGLGVVGSVIGVGAIAYQNIPAVHRAVDSAFLDHLKGLLSKETPITTTTDVKPFNPNISTEDAQKVQIGTHTRPITEEEKQSFRSTPPVLKILPGELQPRTTIMLPGDNLQPRDIVKVEKDYNPNVLSQITHKQENTMMGYNLTYNRPEIAISLSFIPGIDKAKRIEVYQRKPWSVNGKEYFTGIYAVITMPDGTRLGTTIGAPEDVRDIKPLIDSLPIFSLEESIARSEGRHYTPGLEITPETPLVATARSNAVISVFLGGGSNSNTPGLSDFAFDSALKTDDSGNLLLNQK